MMERHPWVGSRWALPSGARVPGPQTGQHRNCPLLPSFLHFLAALPAGAFSPWVRLPRGSVSGICCCFGIVRTRISLGPLGPAGGPGQRPAFPSQAGVCLTTTSPEEAARDGQYPRYVALQNPRAISQVPGPKASSERTGSQALDLTPNGAHAQPAWPPRAHLLHGTLGTKTYQPWRGMRRGPIFLPPGQHLAQVTGPPRPEARGGQCPLPAVGREGSHLCKLTLAIGSQRPHGIC